MDVEFHSGWLDWGVTKGVRDVLPRHLIQPYLRLIYGTLDSAGQKQIVQPLWTRLSELPSTRLFMSLTAWVAACITSYRDEDGRLYGQPFLRFKTCARDSTDSQLNKTFIIVDKSNFRLDNCSLSRLRSHVPHSSNFRGSATTIIRRAGSETNPMQFGYRGDMLMLPRFFPGPIFLVNSIMSLKRLAQTTFQRLNIRHFSI